MPLREKEFQFKAHRDGHSLVFLIYTKKKATIYFTSNIYNIV